MEELIQQLMNKAGLSREQAIQSLEVIKDYIQSQLPPMMQGMVDNFLSGQQDASDDRLGS